MKRCRDSQCTRGELAESEFGPDRLQKDGLTKKCRACLARYRREHHAKNREKYNEYQRLYVLRHAEGAMLKRAKSRAKQKGRPFNLELDDIVIPETCPIFGKPFVRQGGVTDFSPSLDCIDPQRGYVKGNVRVISYRANRIKCDASLDELRAIVKFMEQGD